MLYSFEEHVAEMRISCKDDLCNYEKYVESLEGISDVKDTEFYKSYLSKFEAKDTFGSVHLAVPEDLQFDFDYDLLLILVCASHSSNYNFELNPDLDSFRLGITVKSGDEKVHKYLDELWSFQIYRLFEIYISEQVSLFAMAKSPDGCIEQLEEERKTLLQKFRLAVNDLITEKFNKELFAV